MSVPRRDDGFDRVSYGNRASTRRDIGSRVPAVITAVVAAAFLGFAFFPSRPTANAGPSSVNATAAPHALPTSPPPLAHTAQPAAPQRIANLQPIVEPINKATTEFLRQTGRMPDPNRPIDREAARQATRKLDGVRSAFWIDRENLMVMVDGSERRSMATIDQVCIALQPLGDTLSVIVNVQDITAQNPDAATTLTRNCQLPEGQRAFGQSKRQVDVVGAETSAVFKDQQARK